MPKRSPTPRWPLLAAGLAVAGLAGCVHPRAAGGGDPGIVAVRLMHRERAVAGAVFAAVRQPGVAFREERVAGVAGEDGRAVLRLAPGAWFISARAEEAGLFGWYGSNPVAVREGERLEFVLPAVPLPAPARAAAVPPGEEGIAGAVLDEVGAAVAAVTFYLDAATFFRGPGYAEAQAGPDGRFEARLSPGRYWLVARRRRGPGVFGPLEVGDLFGFYPDNPVEVRAGERVDVVLPVVRVLKKSGWSGPSTLRTRVAGVVRDAAGRPLAGYRAFLHAKEAMLGKPEFVSEPSGPDGAYVIWVDREGVFHLGVRAEIGRAREEGETIGVYAGAAGDAVSVRLGAGDLTGLDIVVPDAGGAP